MTACVGANPSPQSATKLTDSAPRDRGLEELSSPQGHPLESGISPAAGRTTEGRDGGKLLASPSWHMTDDLTLINALEIEEA